EEQKRLIRERTDLWVQTQDNNADTDRSSPNTEKVCLRTPVAARLARDTEPARIKRAGPGPAPLLCLHPAKNTIKREGTQWDTQKEAPAPVPAGSGPIRKERISFRDNPVQLSQGWGGGKKRSKPNK
ncbi:hypothetical protein JZ751_003539, partial [Albula glossodonta]